MVLSSRAFGLADPTPPLVPIYTAVISATDTKRINVTLGPGAATCVPTASSPTTPSVVASQYLVVGTPNRASATPPNGTLVPGGTHSFYDHQDAERQLVDRDRVPRSLPLHPGCHDHRGLPLVGADVRQVG